MDKFYKQEIAKYIVRVNEILSMTPEAYCISQHITLDHALAKHYAGLQVSIENLLFWLERCGEFGDNAHHD